MVDSGHTRGRHKRRGHFEARPKRTHGGHVADRGRSHGGHMACKVWRQTQGGHMADQGGLMADKVCIGTPKADLRRRQGRHTTDSVETRPKRNQRGHKVGVHKADKVWRRGQSSLKADTSWPAVGQGRGRGITR